ncbi:Phosphoinositide phospholipase C 4 [Platanthera guangdongensis]|uniref:Phosphoinositide phospholipase C 4 n=1 Tax=Platanthera guangdongensis TaxID=2320717 RepID=A0ABR2LI14_9ASPA
MAERSSFKKGSLGALVEVLRTLTSPVDLLKCLNSIKEFAFVASEYPVVITLEDHLTPDLQAKVAEMVIDTFGDMLYYPNSDHVTEFPSPELLKKKIILSTKPPKEYLESKSFKEENKSQTGKTSNEEEAWGKEVPDLKTAIETYEQEDNNSDHDDEDDDPQQKSQAPALQYKHLITIRAGKPKGSLIDALKADPNNVRRLSLSEQQLTKAAATHGTDLVRSSRGERAWHRIKGRSLCLDFPKAVIEVGGLLADDEPFEQWMGVRNLTVCEVGSRRVLLWLA